MDCISANTRKILITGSVGSGKSTLARKLSRETGLPLIELDRIAHPKDYSDYRRSPEEQKTVLDSLDRNGGWIMEGTDRKYQRYLFDWADLIIIMNPPLKIRKRRILTRYFKQVTGLEKCRYKPTLKLLRMMYQWTADHEKSIEKFQDFLSQYGNKVHYYR